VDEHVERIRARARLALRAERAFGLRAIKVPQVEAPQGQAVHSPPAALQGAPQTPRVSQIDATATTAPRSDAAARDLFGNCVSSTPSLLSPPASSAPSLPRSDRVTQLKVLNETAVSVCRKCRLCETRTNTVFGEGDPEAQIFFIGEGPGENEDLKGRPFVGRAGELLDKWIAAMGLKRELVYIANIVKCRPPGNREPAPDEVAACTPFLERQLELIRPRVIITLGRPAAQQMLATKISMGRLRGQWHEWRGMRLMPTYHPAYVLRSYTYETRSAVWSDLQMVMKELGLPLPARKSS
jgi:DNA polymerase